MAALLIVETRRTLELNFFNAARRHRPYAAWITVEAWARPLLAVAALVTFKVNAQMILLGYVVATAAGLVVFRRYVQRDASKCAIQEELLSANWKAEIRNYVLPLIPLALVGWISTLSDRYVIGAILGLEKVGIYAAIYALISRPFALAGNIFITTLRPIFFEAVAIGDRERAKAVLRYWVSSLGAIFLGGIFLLFLLKDWIAGLLLAVPYRAGTHLMLWIGIGAAILSLAQVFNTVSLAHKRSRYVLCSESAGAAAALFIGVPMVWCFGLSGAALAVPLSFSIQLGTAFWLARRSNLGPLALPCGRPQPQYIPWKEAA